MTKKFQEPRVSATHPQGEALTTAQGTPLRNTDTSLKAGPRGPVLLQDHHLREKITHFDHERIPNVPSTPAEQAHMERFSLTGRPRKSAKQGSSRKVWKLRCLFGSPPSLGREGRRILCVTLAGSPRSFTLQRATTTW